MRRLAILLGLAACTTPRDPLERDDLLAVPFAHAGDPPAPAVLARPAAERIGEVLRDVATRGGATLEDCFRIAEASNEALLAGDEARLQALLARDEALAAFLPEVDLEVTHFRQNVVRLGGTGGGTGVVTTSPDRTQWALRALQPIFDGFRDWYAMQAEERTAEAREAAREDLRRRLLSSVARAFYGVLQSEAEGRTLEEARRRDTARVEEMRERFALGLARRTEVLLNESNLATTEADLLRARTDLEVRRAVLRSLLGAPLAAPLLEEPAEAGPLPPLEEARLEALAARPDLRAALAEAEAAQARLDSVRGEFLPSVSLAANRYLHRQHFAEFPDETEWDALLAVDVPIFAGGARRARYRTAASELRQSRLLVSSTRRSVAEEVEATHARVSRDEEILRTQETRERSARENLRLLEEENRAGIATNLEVLVAQTALDNARLDLDRQRLLTRLDRVELDVAMGRVSP
ncbi:MAG: TolC family protein [Planctomycetes bacterium]|nr:TolC family protein [Planctomycetota bacterium]